MCSSKSRHHQSTSIAKINGRPVLQPKSNQVPSLERRNSLKKNPSKPPASQAAPALLPQPTLKNKPSSSPPISPKLKSPATPAIKSLSASAEKVLLVPVITKNTPEACNMKIYTSFIGEAPGSIAAARREQVATMQKERKMRISHYGRTNSAKQQGKVAPINGSVGREEKRCSFITSNSDPIYVAYHDEEWGVAVHDDKLLFELLVMTGAQVGSDWTSVLRRREAFRKAFSGFDAEVVAKFNEKKMASVSAEYGIEMSQVRGVVDNSNRILAVVREFGSFDKYLWGFVNHKPISTKYKSCQKIPVKTSKSESISKDMVKRGFRLVGPIVIHSFMQAAGLSNDHLITCPRHHQCTLL